MSAWRCASQSSERAVSNGPVDRGVRSVAIAGKLNCAALEGLFDHPARSTVARVGARESPKISYLVRPLLDLGLELHLITLSEDTTESFDVTGRNVTLTVCPSRTSGRGRDAFARERRVVTEAVLSRPVDLVHAHQTYEYALGALASGLPTLITVRDWAMAVGLEPRAMYSLNRTGYLATKVGMQLVTLVWGKHFTVNSPYLERRIRRVVRGRTPVIPNCLPPGMAMSTPRKLNGEKPCLVAVNRGFGRRKNVTSLLRAFSLVRERFSDARLVLVGPGYEAGGAAETWAAKHGLDARVEFRGPLPPEKVGASLGSADLMIHPSREESFGIVLMEAMSHGTPVIGGAHSGAVPWVLGNGRAGVLTDVTNPKVMAKVICELLGDPVRWKELSNRGRREVTERFDSDAVAYRYVQEYNHVVAASAR